MPHDPHPTHEKPQPQPTDEPTSVLAVESRILESVTLSDAHNNRIGLTLHIRNRYREPTAVKPMYILDLALARDLHEKLGAVLSTYS